ncbi:MAG: NADPH:quinone oxidoreductase family protein [Alphaproteobacteria bacterium]|nr:NADPH:quinone oxidoreductase family protein [Alphaproteobacteria bacterium]
MRALVCRELSADLSGVRLERAWPDPPPPGPGKVRVRLAYAALNFPDLLMTRGLYQMKPELPFVPGGEAAGHVQDVGEGVEGVAPGDPVIASLATGGLAERALLPAAALRPVPDGLTLAEAAGFTTMYMTAFVALDRRGRLAAGETLLVHGAAGGVGLAAVDLGLVIGARVIATASTPDKRAFLAERGAHHVIAPEPGFREEVKALTGGRGADVIYDPVGGAVFAESMRCIAWDGRLLVVGFASGTIPQLTANIPLIKGFSVVGVRAGEHGRRHPEDGRACRAAIDGLAAEGRLRPHVGAVLPLGDAIEGLRRLDRREAVGKIVIDCAA